MLGWITIIGIRISTVIVKMSSRIVTVVTSLLTFVYHELWTHNYNFPVMVHFDVLTLLCITPLLYVFYLDISLICLYDTCFMPYPQSKMVSP